MRGKAGYEASVLSHRRVDTYALGWINAHLYSFLPQGLFDSLKQF